MGSGSVSRWNRAKATASTCGATLTPFAPCAIWAGISAALSRPHPRHGRLVRPPPVPPVPPTPPMFPDIEGFVWRSGNNLGITVGDLPDQLADYFGTKDGVLVTSVTDSSAASKAGLKAGDVITSLNGVPVTEPSDLRRRVQRLQDGDELTMGVVRDKKTLTLKGKMETPRSRRTYRSLI